MKTLLLLSLLSFNLYAQTVVSTSPALSEIISTLGFEKNIIARTPYCLDAQEAPKVGTALELDIEKVLSLKPDLVLLQENTESKTSINLKKLNIKYKNLKLVSLDDIYQATSELAALFGVDGLDVLNKYKTSGKSKYKKGLVMLGGIPGKSVMIAGTETFYSQIIEQLGMKNLSPSKNWPNLQAEKIRSLIDKDTVILEVVTKKEALWSQSDWQSFCPKCHVVPLVSKRAAYPGLKVIEIISNVLSRGSGHD